MAHNHSEIAPDWDSLGGDEVMQPLLEDFYQRVATSNIRALFPPDFTDTVKKQFAFQSEFWGGPPRYSSWRGFPRLRARHLPFVIRQQDADTWMSCMRQAVQHSDMPEQHRSYFLRRMSLTANAMVNHETAR